MVEIRFSTSNAAFHDDNGNEDEYYRNLEVARILREIAEYQTRILNEAEKISNCIGEDNAEDT